MSGNGKQYVLPKGKRKKVIEAALKVADKVWCDYLDCRESVVRQRSDKTPQWILENALKSDNGHFVFIERLDLRWGGEKNYWDTGCIFTDYDQRISYYLFIEVNHLKGWDLVKKFKLENIV